MAGQFIFAVPYSNSDLGTVVLLGRRRIIQKFRDGKQLDRPVIPHWAGQVTPLGGAAPLDQPLYTSISEIFEAQTGQPIPISEDAAEFSAVSDAKGNTALVLPIPVSEDSLKTLIRTSNQPLLGQEVADPLFEELLPASVFALGDVFGPTPVPEGGWERYMYRNYFTRYRPGVLDLLPPTILKQLTVYSQQPQDLFLAALDKLPEQPITIKLTGIAVIGAKQDPKTGTWVTPFHTDGAVQLRVQTDSSDPLAAELVAWEIDGKDAGTGPFIDIGADQMIDQDAPIIVSARLGQSEQTVTLAVRPDVERFWVDGAEVLSEQQDGHVISARTVYGSDAAPVEVRLELQPDTPEAYKYVTWTGGEKPSGGANDRRLIPRNRVTPKGTPARVTARINPQFDADVVVLPHLAGMFADGNPVAHDGQIGVVYTGADDHQVTLRVETDPDNGDAWGHLVWQGGNAGPTANTRIVPLNGIQPGHAPIEVKVGNGGDEEITVQIRVAPRLTGIEIVGFGEATDATHGRAFRTDIGPPVILRALTDPASPAAAALVTWHGGAEDWRQDGMAAVDRTVGHDVVRNIRARIGAQEAQMDLSLEDFNAPDTMGLSVSQITFENTTPLYDDDDNAIDQVWRRGVESPPESFVRNTVIRLSARFTLNPRPAEDAQIILRGTAWVPLAGGGVTLMRWTSAAIDVPHAGPTPGQVDLAATNASVALANEVSYQARRNAGAALAAQRWPLQILWEMRPAAGGVWRQIGTSNHPTYVMLGAPAAGCEYFQTSFDIGCRNADGAATLAAAIAGTYAAFEARDPITGANDEMRRSSDNHRLIYWLTGHPQQNLTGMLANPAGNGSCAAFTDLLLDMLISQGIAVTHAGNFIQVRSDTTVAPHAGRFAVAAWQFNPATATQPFAGWHWANAGGGGANTCHWAQGPGQNQQNPPPLFVNHFITGYGGRFYDASYGTARQNNFDDWSRVSIAGLENRNNQRIGYAGPPPPGTAVTRQV